MNAMSTFWEMEKKMLPDRVIKINRFAQTILRSEKLDQISAVELAQRLHPDLLKDSDHRPGLPLRKLLRSSKIIGGYQAKNKRWFIRQVENFTNIYSVKEIQEMCGFDTPKPIYDRINKGQIPISTLSVGNTDHKTFSEDEIIPWVQSQTKEAKSKVEPNDNQSKELIEKAGQLVEQLEERLDQLPSDLHNQVNDMINALNDFHDATPQQIAFQIPAKGNSITEMDIRKGQVRITKENKKYFPGKDAIIMMRLGSVDYQVRYKYRTTRSNILFIGKEICSKMNLVAGDSFSVAKISELEYQLIDGNQLLTERKAPKGEFDSVIDSLEDRNLSETEPAKFELIGTIGELMKTKLPKVPALTQSGVYQIRIHSGYKVGFRTEKEIEEAKNVISSWSLLQLEDKWVTNTTVIYIGLAGARSPRSLRKRLSDLLRHGNGKTTDRGPHAGGDILWTLTGYEDFEIWVMPTGDPPRPRNVERKMLAEFVNRHSKLPFANRQF
jgi:hypothetical protein